MSKAQIPHNVAQRMAERLLLYLGPYCERIEIAGSIRRCKPVVGDIEIVAIPKIGRDLFGECDPKQDYLAAYLEGLVSAGKIFKSPAAGDVRGAWGQKYKKFWLKINEAYGEIQVDLFLCDARNWGNILTIRTGSGDFSEALVTRIKHRTPYRQQEGYLVNQETGEVVPVPDERDYFRLAGVEWVEPKDRTGAYMVRAQVDRNNDLGVPVNNSRNNLRTEFDSSDTGTRSSEPPKPGGIVYTCDEDVRAAIRARIEMEAGIGE